MNRFVRKTSFFVFPLLLIIMAIIFTYGSAIPNVSNSISFNVKMLFIKKKKITSDFDVLCLGSSMTLNNIHSETITDCFGTKYLNVSSWGQSIEQDYRLLKIFAPRHKPKFLIISSNFMDFEDKPFKIKFDLLKKYLYGNNPLSGFDLRYNIKISDDYNKHLKEKNSYKYLNYDPYGGINLSGRDLKIDPKRWKGRSLVETKINTKHYSYLDSIANYAQEKGIEFLLVQSPFREGYFSSLNESDRKFLELHTHKIKIVVEKYGHRFINTTEHVWPDSLFIDYSHLNKKGAKMYTDTFLKQMK